MIGLSILVGLGLLLLGDGYQPLIGGLIVVAGSIALAVRDR